MREALRRAAAERRSEVKPKAELLAAPVRPAESRLIQMLVEAEGFREKLAQAVAEEALHRGLETERIFEVLVSKVESGRTQPRLPRRSKNRDRRVLFEILFEPSIEATWEEAESCLGVLRSRPVEQELAELQKKIESQNPPNDLNRLLSRRLELQKMLAAAAK